MTTTTDTLNCRHCDGKGQDVYQTGEGTWEPYLCEACEGCGVDLLEARLQMLAMLKRIHTNVSFVGFPVLLKDLETLIVRASDRGGES